MKYSDANVLFQPYINDVFYSIEEFLSSLKEVHDDDVYIISKSVSDVFATDVLRTSIRTQMYLKEKNHGAGSESKYSSWASTPEAYMLVQKQYPELIRILEVKKKNFIAYIKSVLTRFSNDRKEILRQGLPAGSKVVDLIISDGDSHQSGQRVCFLKTDIGQIVYKPHSVMSDTIIAQAASIVNKNLPEGITVKIPNTLDCSTHGWQEFIEYIPASTKSELESYYRSLGGITAFFAAFGGHDFHYENIIISQGSAVPVDLETSFGNLQYVKKISRSTNLLDKMNQVATFSGVSTLILPPLVRTERFDIDISPITDGIPQKSKTMRGGTLSVTEKGDIKFHMEAAEVNKLNPHSEAVSTSIAHPRWYIENFSDGHYQVSQAIKYSLVELNKFLNTFDKPIPNRCVIRPTATYAAFLDTSYHPKYLVSYKARKSLFTRLGYPPASPSEIGKAALEAESIALLDGDIPYFTDSILSNLVAGVDDDGIKGCSVDNFKSIPSKTLKVFGNLSGDVINYIHHGAFAGIDSEVWDTRYDGEIKPFFYLNFQSNSWNDILNNLAMQAHKLSVWDKDNDLASMYMQIVGTDHRVQTVPLNATYYEGQGILWLFHEASFLEEDIDYTALLTAMLRGFVDTPSYTSDEPISGFVGNFSQIRLVSLVRRYLGDEIAKNLVATLIKWAHERIDKTTESELKVDYVTGLSGALAALGMLKESFGHEVEVRFLRDRMQTVVINSLVKGDLEDTYGIAHGPLGLMLGLVLGGAPLTDNEQRELRTLVRRRVEEELKQVEMQSAVTKHAWCSGISGIAEAFAYVLNATGGLDARDRKLLVKLYEQFQHDVTALRGPTDFSLCHGLGGELLAWYRTTCLLPELNLVENVMREAIRLRWQLRDGDLEVRGGVRHATSSLAMMLGMSGVVIALSLIESGQEFTDFPSF